jgi:hypothetical protein
LLQVKLTKRANSLKEPKERKERQENCLIRHECTLSICQK